MTQYFKYVNPEREEWISLPGPMSPVERLTNPVATAMVTYVLFNGPMDGTAFTGMVDTDSDEYQEALEEFKKREKETEESEFERYMEEKPDYIARQFERKHGYEPDRTSEEFKEFCHEKSMSVYRKNNWNWDRDKMQSAVAAGFHISDLDYAGRWAGDPVQLVGDYAESELYDEAKTNWRYEHTETGEEFISYATVAGPIIPDSIEADGAVHKVRAGPIEKGDLCQVRHPETGDEVYAHYMGEAESEWTDITDGVMDELVELVGEEWVEDASEIGRINPSMVLRA